MSLYLDIFIDSMKIKYLDSLSEDEYVESIHVEKKLKI